MDEAVDAVVVQRMTALLYQCKFFSLSCGESRDNSRISQLLIHLYVVTKYWEMEAPPHQTLSHSHASYCSYFAGSGFVRAEEFDWS
jgi:hypothetical protein